MYTVELRSCGNVDYNQDPNKPMFDCAPDELRHVDSIADASIAVSDFIHDNDLGSGNWIGGLVRKDGVIVADVSYNGRVWEYDGTTPRYSGTRKEIVDATQPKRYPRF